MRDSDVQRIIGDLQKTYMVYSEEFDCYYNPKTNEWTEPKCSDPECHYCSRRPERPLENGKPF
jgi:hypothetical protein